MFPLKDDIPSSRMPVLTVLLIAANVLIFFWEKLNVAGFEATIWKWGLVPYEFTHQVELTPGMDVPPFTNVFSSMFMHGGFFHLAGNMLYLWIFGDNVEDQLGHVRFLLFYLLSGVVAALSFTYLFPSSKVPLVGASGAIAGVLGGYLLRFPRARIYTLIFLGFFVQVVRIPALIVLGFWFVIQLLNAGASFTVAATSGTAWFAHVGGFVAGFLLFPLLGGMKRRAVHYDNR
jgi:membrane associated rhomboid family serine protease